MSNIFYDRVIDWEEFEAAVHTLTRDPVHRAELSRMADEILHHVMFHRILDLLPHHTHEYFIVEFKAAPHAEKHWQFLQTYEPEVEQHLRAAAIETHRKFLDTIHGKGYPAPEEER